MITYTLFSQNGKTFMKLHDIAPQILDIDEVGMWMREARENNRELYPELVHAYVLMKKGIE